MIYQILFLAALYAGLMYMAYRGREGDLWYGFFIVVNITAGVFGSILFFIFLGTL